MKWFFQPRPDGDGARHDDDDSAPGLISLLAERAPGWQNLLGCGPGSSHQDGRHPSQPGR
jgi:hypothetical protein